MVVSFLKYQDYSFALATQKISPTVIRQVSCSCCLVAAHLVFIEVCNKRNVLGDSSMIYIASLIPLFTGMPGLFLFNVLYLGILQKEPFLNKFESKHELNL